MASNEVEEIFQIDTRPIRALSWSHEGNFLASSSYSGQNTTIAIWDVSDVGSNPILIELGSEVVTSLEFNSQNTELITVDVFDGLRVWDIFDGSLLYNDPLASLEMAIHISSNQLVTAPLSPIFVLWDLSSGYRSVEISQLSANGISATDQAITAMTWNSASTHVATGQHNGVTRIWDTSTSPIVTIHVFEANDADVVDWDVSAVRDVTFLNDDREVATISSNGRLRSWNLLTEQVLIDDDLGQLITVAEFSLDGIRLAYGTASGAFEIIDVDIMAE